MNKTELIAEVAMATGLSRVDAKKAVEATLNTIAEAIKNEAKVALIGFGTFSVATRAAHQGINPATKESITIPEKKVVKFKAGSDMAL